MNKETKTKLENLSYQYHRAINKVLIKENRYVDKINIKFKNLPTNEIIRSGLIDHLLYDWSK